jgi:hypothetical protein
MLDASMSPGTAPDTAMRAGAGRVPIVALGMALGTLLAVTFALCVGFDLIWPQLAMYETWIRLLPGVTWLSWPSFLLGLVESFGYGWFAALIFAPIYNLFAAR